MAFSTSTLQTEVELIFDSSGKTLISPDSLPHAYTYNASNQLIADTMTDGTNTWIKTFVYSGSNLTAESAWVKQ